MNFSARPTPARVSAAAAAQLPRWAVALLLAAYGLAGLFGRDPWYQDDAASFGVMWTMAHGSAADWWLPNVLGVPHLEEGPLPFWLGAALMTVFGGWLGDPLAARLTCLLWLLLATGSVWYAMYRLARRDEAQPVAFAFGGEASTRDYARLQADIALLLFLATIGLVNRMHETTAETASVAWVAFALYGLAFALRAPRAGAVVTGLAVGALALTRGPVSALALLAASIAAVYWLLQGRTRGVFVVVAVAVALAVFAVWPVGALLYDPASAQAHFYGWSQWALDSVGLASTHEFVWIGRNVVWYAWPLWPLAGWAIYSWRHSLSAPHIALPAASAAVLFAAMLLFETVNEAALVLTIPPLILLAAFGVTTLRRAAENVTDWLSIALFSLLSLAAWGYYIAMVTGTPPKMAASVARMTQGFAPAVEWLAVFVALLATVLWLALIWWRVREHPPMLWRGPIMAAAGLTTLWILLSTLFMPAVNYNRTFAGIAQQAAERIAASGGRNSCVQAHYLAPAHRALFALHGGLRFAPLGDEMRCTYALHRDTQRSHLDDDPPRGNWTLIWEGQWPTRRDESIKIYRRQGE